MTKSFILDPTNKESVEETLIEFVAWTHNEGSIVADSHDLNELLNIWLNLQTRKFNRLRAKRAKINNRHMNRLKMEIKSLCDAYGAWHANKLKQYLYKRYNI